MILMHGCISAWTAPVRPRYFESLSAQPSLALSLSHHVEKSAYPPHLQLEKIEFCHSKIMDESKIPFLDESDQESSSDFPAFETSSPSTLRRILRSLPLILSLFTNIILIVFLTTKKPTIIQDISRYGMFVPKTRHSQHMHIPRH